MYMNVLICNITIWHLCVKVKGYSALVPPSTLSLCVGPEGEPCIS